MAWHIAFMVLTIMAAALVFTGVALSFIGPLHAVLFAAVATAVVMQQPLRALPRALPRVRHQRAS